MSALRKVTVRIMVEVGDGKRAAHSQGQPHTVEISDTVPLDVLAARFRDFVEREISARQPVKSFLHD